jgi:hypothetical protein
MPDILYHRSRDEPLLISNEMIAAGVKVLTSATLGQVCFPEGLAIDVYLEMEKARNERRQCMR